MSRGTTDPTPGIRGIVTDGSGTLGMLSGSGMEGRLWAAWRPIVGRRLRRSMSRGLAGSSSWITRQSPPACGRGADAVTATSWTILEASGRAHRSPPRSVISSMTS